MSPKESMTGVLMIVEYDAEELFANESPAWEYASTHSEFEHRDACEFMFYIGGDTQAFLDRIKMHSDSGCPQELISYLKHARDVGAAWAIFYA